MCRFLVGLLFGAVSAAAGDGGDRRDRVVFTASERLRGEFVDWFRPHTGARSANRYGFLGSRLRAGVSVDVPPPPVRRPRPGHPLRQPARRRRRAANRCARTRGPLLSPHARSLAGRAVPEARLPHAPAKRLRGDRWAVRDADGLETEPADPTLAFVKRFRIAERLVGPFSYSHVSRSFDGGRLSYDRPGWNVTAMAARPTHGGFEVSANREIGEGCRHDNRGKLT